jgi:hypothetical protein
MIILGPVIVASREKRNGLTRPLQPDPARWYALPAGQGVGEQQPRPSRWSGRATPLAPERMGTTPAATRPGGT